MLGTSLKYIAVTSESLIDLAYKSGKFPGMQPSESDDDEFDEFDDYDDIMI